MPNITLREYNPESGALLGNVSVLNFGKIKAGASSRVKVVDIAFSDVSSVSNIKLGLIGNANLSVNPSPDAQDGNGTTANGHFGIENTAAFDAAKASAPLSRHYAGVNTTITATDVNNVAISKRSSFITNYIYLDIETSSTNVDAGNGAYKIFFDYS